jgi:Fe-S-cluster containining protein
MINKSCRTARFFAAQAGSLVYHPPAPVFLECQRCTACCRWPGQVRLNDAEITRLAAFKVMPERDFIELYTRLRPDRRGLSLLEKPNGECIFLEGENCAVQPVKPQQCREFPNLWNFPGFEKICHAIPREVSEAEYQRRIALIKAKGNAAAT